MLRKSKALGLLITLLCLGLAFYRVDLSALYTALAGANYALVPPAALCTLTGYVVRTARWRVILAEVAPCRFATLFGILMVGFAANNLMPARLGELARAFLLRRRSGVRKTFLLATIFLERLFDGLVLVAIFSALSLFVDLPGWGREVELIAAGVFLAVAVAVVALLARREVAERLLRAALRPFPDRLASWTSGAFGAFLAGLGTMRRPSALLRTAALSVVVWSLEWASYYVLSGAFPLGLGDGQRAAACALLLILVNLGIMLPSSPGYIGTFQFFAVAALTVFGVEREPALALAIVAHLSQYILVTAIGAAFFGREHVSLRHLSADATEETPVPTVGSGVAT
jgi:glycosyltransferase 2 family protein